MQRPFVCTTACRVEELERLASAHFRTKMTETKCIWRVLWPFSLVHVPSINIERIYELYRSESPRAIEGIVHRKIIIHPSPRPYVDGGVGEVFESTQNFWSLGRKLCSSQIPIQVKSMVSPSSDIIKHNCSCGGTQVSASPDIHIQVETTPFTPFIKPECPLEVAKLAEIVCPRLNI